MNEKGRRRHEEHAPRSPTQRGQVARDSSPPVSTPVSTRYGILVPPRERRPHPPVWRSMCSGRMLLLLLWLPVLLVGEHLLFHYSVALCSGPPGDVTSPSKVLRLALIGDPQLTDRHSYSFLQGPLSPLSGVIEFYSDIYMRKSFQLMQRYHQLDGIVFMGDLLDSAKFLSEEEFKREAKRFQWVFEAAGETSVPRFYLSGNHDIGYDIDPRHQAQLAQRFVSQFGPLNTKTTMKGIELVFLSATTVSDEVQVDPALYAETSRFVDEMARKKNKAPRVLFHHIPLWRPPNADCGPMRQRNPALKDRSGFSYTNMLGQSLSQRLLSAIRPFLTFSGDDHDYCKHRHTNTTTEYTIGTFSWLQGNPNPSFALVTIHPLEDEKGKEGEVPTARVEACFLPNQKYIYIAYGLVAFLSVIFIAIDPLSQERKTRSVLTLENYRDMARLGFTRFVSSATRYLSTALFLFGFYCFLLWQAL